MSCHPSRSLWRTVVLVIAIAGCAPQSSQDGYRDITSVPAPAKPEKDDLPSQLTRLFFQDYETKTLKWADVLDGSPPALGQLKSVDGFPELDSQRQQLVQMELAGGLILVGVRENGDERKENGWILVHTGVEEESHGDHSHWHYESSPRVLARQLDGKQGNPAHAYQYDGVFYLANDENSGYTRLDPAAIGEGDDETAIRAKAGFHQGGGHHITLAVAEADVGYSGWIDGGGPNKGRVDVTSIKPEGNTKIAYSFSLPSGGIHGAAVCQDKVFFAPADGICWVPVDRTAKADPKDVPVNHISLGRDDAANKPLRTGAFATNGKHVVFVTGEGTNAALCLLDASQEKPEVTKVGLQMKPGNRPVPAEVVLARDGRRLAFVFHDHPQDVEAENRLSVIDLDPDANGDFTDARALKSLEVGPSRLEGHYGHHSIAFDADGRYACFTNPGAGTLVVLNLQTLEPAATFSVGGVPTAIVAWGGLDIPH